MVENSAEKDALFEYIAKKPARTDRLPKSKAMP
jgi:hypothetical protein